MTTVTNPDFESKIVRGQPDNAGKFAAKSNSAPDISINPRADLDAVNVRYQDTQQSILTEAENYLKHGMPASAHRVRFEFSDQGDYMTVAEAYDANGEPVDTHDEGYDE